MRKIVAALAALPLAFAFVNPAVANHVSGHGDAVGPVQWVGCADIGDVQITELGDTRLDEDDPGSEGILGFGGEAQGEERVVDGVRAEIWVYKGSCLSQERLGSPQHAVTFNAFLHRKDVDRSIEPATETFSATSQSVDVRTVKHITDPNDEFMLHLTLEFIFEDADGDGFPDDGYVDDTDGDGEGTLSDFYYCLQTASFIHKKAADWGPDLVNGQFDTENPLCTDGQAGQRSAG